MRRPSVLFINRVYPPSAGATGRVLRDLARAFAKEGWQVTVLTTGPKALKERDGSIRVVRVKARQNPRGILAYGWIWLKLLIAGLRLPGGHLLVTMTDPPLLVLAGQIIRKFKKGRHIHWCHDLYPDILPALGVKLPGFVMEGFKKLSRRAMTKADKLIVIGRCMARHLTYNGIDPKHITVIPNWPDFELSGTPSGRNSYIGQAAANLDVEGVKPFEEQIKAGPKFRVLYAGNLGRAHPVETILKAAEILDKENPEIEFVFVGDGKGFEEIARERSRRSLENIRFLPYQPPEKLREVMESGDVHLISVREDTAGMMVPSKLYAALAVGRPCIFLGPAASETAKVITDFKAGCVIPQGQAAELAAQIRRYRYDGDDWFSAHTGAASAGQVFVPREAINAWIERAWGVVEAEVADPGMAEAA